MTNLRVLVSAKEEENVKLLRQAGATTIITPSTFGGSMLAAASHGHIARYIEDLLTLGASRSGRGNGSSPGWRKISV